jgi:uncharacterized protein
MILYKTHFNHKIIIKRIFYGLVLIPVFILSCQTEQVKTTDPDYVDKMIELRKQKDVDLLDTSISRFNEEERKHFAEKGLQYFKPDAKYIVEATITVDTNYPVFQMPTTTERKPNYRIYGILEFILKDTACRLIAYQNMDFVDDPEYGGSLFIPFKDNTNEFTTYGGGRYIDIKIPGKKQFSLDFNLAYNPYCAYSERWSCPLVPLNNTLELSVMAGEKAYK